MAEYILKFSRTATVDCDTCPIADKERVPYKAKIPGKLFKRRRYYEAYRCRIHPHKGLTFADYGRPEWCPLEKVGE